MRCNRNPCSLLDHRNNLGHLYMCLVHGLYQLFHFVRKSQMSIDRRIQEVRMRQVIRRDMICVARRRASDGDLKLAIFIEFFALAVEIMLMASQGNPWLISGVLTGQSKSFLHSVFSQIIDHLLGAAKF